MFAEKLVLKVLLLPILIIIWVGSCEKESKEEESPEWKELIVSASAYNSVAGQGSGNSQITAWGDTLKPGIKVIAVSRDLIELGLDHNTPVRIEGFEGVFRVADKMHPRWRNKIDIYMGDDKEKALKWGRREVCIYFLPSEKAN